MKRYLYLPKQYNLVVGDTFELFYQGLVNFLTIENYDFELFYEDGENRGKGFSKKYIFTPTEQDIGTHVLHIRLWSNEGDVLEEGSVKINVAPPPESPEDEHVVLLIGASDASPGVWPSEVGRRLIGEGGTPAGYGLKNVSFIGSRECDGIRYEGYGGWSFTSYSTENKRNDFMILSGDFSDKEESVDQHSTYQDENGELWKLESISNDRMKIICRSALGKLPSVDGGRLTHVSGGAHMGDVVYTSAICADSNPFWNSEKGKNDFVSYARRFGKEKIDEIVVTLTWNSHYLSAEDYLACINKFVSSVHADFPECHISFAGAIYPSRDGFGQNYGISWGWFSKLSTMRAFDDLKIAMAEENPGRFSFIHISSQYDVENNSVTAEFDANARNDKKIVHGSNGIHITKMGSHQVADAIVRHLCARWDRKK